MIVVLNLWPLVKIWPEELDSVSTCSTIELVCTDQTEIK